jgi:hypothetical protein
MNKNQFPAGHQWLIPVILATQEARDQEDCGLEPALANSLWDPISKKKKKSQKKLEWVAQGVGPEFKPQ